SVATREYAGSGPRSVGVSLIWSRRSAPQFRVELRVPLWVFVQAPKDGAARIPDTRDLGFRKGLNRQVLQAAMGGVRRQGHIPFLQPESPKLSEDYEVPDHRSGELSARGIAVRAAITVQYKWVAIAFCKPNLITRVPKAIVSVD